MSRKWTAGAAALIMSLTGLLAGPGPAASDRDDVVLALKDRVVRDLSSQGLTLAFHIGMTNQTSAPRSLVRYRYRVTVNQGEFLNMDVEVKRPIAVPPGRENLISLPVRISYELLFAAVGRIEEKAVCNVVGDMFFLTERGRQQRVRFAYAGEFPIFKDPVVEIRPLVVGDLTVGGAEIVLRPVFRNLNAYELLVERIGFRIAFGGLEAFSGFIPGDKSIPRVGEKAFDIPFLIDFFEAGEPMREQFRKEEISCRFEGEIEVASAWGPLLIRFDKTQTLRLGKTL